MILESQNATSAADGTTAEPKIRINQPADENARCRSVRSMAPISSATSGGFVTFVGFTCQSAWGVVTLSKEERENSGSRIFSSDRDCGAPLVHRRRAKDSVGPCRNEMALNVESV